MGVMIAFSCGDDDKLLLCLFLRISTHLSVSISSTGFLKKDFLFLGRGERVTLKFSLSMDTNDSMTCLATLREILWLKMSMMICMSPSPEADDMAFQMTGMRGYR